MSINKFPLMWRNQEKKISRRMGPDKNRYYLISIFPMPKKPSLLNSLSKKIQTKINTWIPEKIHRAITVAIKQMLRAVLFGATHHFAPIINYNT